MEDKSNANVTIAMKTAASSLIIFHQASSIQTSIIQGLVL